MRFRKLGTASGVFGGATELRFYLYKERRIKIYVNVSETEPAIELSTRHRVLESPEDAVRRRVIEAYPDATFESIGFTFPVMEPANSEDARAGASALPIAKRHCLPSAPDIEPFELPATRVKHPC